MISLRTRFDIHRDLGRWSLDQYAMELGYDAGKVSLFINYLSGKRELTQEEAAMILSRHHFNYRGDELPDEIVSELEKLSGRQ